MRTEKKIGQRVTVFQVLQGVTIHIKSPKQVFALLFLPVWLTGWTVGGVVVIKALLIGEAPPFLAIWLCGWLFGETFALYTWLWTAFGKEIISVEGGVLTVKRDILGYGLKKEFPTQTLHNLRAAGYFGSSNSWNSSLERSGLSGGTIAVDHLDRPYRFGINLEEKEAKAVVEELKPYLPHETEIPQDSHV